MAQGWTGWCESQFQFSREQLRTWHHWVKATPPLVQIHSLLTYLSKITPHGKKSGNIVWEENNTQKEGSSSTGRHRGAHTLCPAVLCKTTSEVDRPAAWGLPSRQATRPHRQATVSLTHFPHSCYLAAREGVWGCGPYYKHSFTVGNAFESDTGMCSQVLLFYRSAHLTPGLMKPWEGMSFLSSIALTVNIETKETEVNTMRPVSTWAESAEKRSHPGLVLVPYHVVWGLYTE